MVMLVRFSHRYTLGLRIACFLLQLCSNAVKHLLFLLVRRKASWGEGRVAGIGRGWEHSECFTGN